MDGPWLVVEDDILMLERLEELGDETPYEELLLPGVEFGLLFGLVVTVGVFALELAEEEDFALLEDAIVLTLLELAAEVAFLLPELDEDEGFLLLELIEEENLLLPEIARDVNVFLLLEREVADDVEDLRLLDSVVRILEVVLADDLVILVDKGLLEGDLEVDFRFARMQSQACRIEGLF